EQGSLEPGDFVVVGSTYGKVRNLETTDGKLLKSAGPSTPVIMTGFKNLPEFGEEFKVVADEKAARALGGLNQSQQGDDNNSSATSGSNLLRIISKNNQLTELNVL